MSLPVSKTPKCYVGGAFIRSESGAVDPLHDAAGRFVANLPRCSRKDLRNAVEAAAKAGPGWAARSPYNRGQILYRLAEMMEARSEELARALLIGREDLAEAREEAHGEVRATIDRCVRFAGWTDKYEALLGSVNPVASPHFNFTVTEAMGVVGVVAPDAPALLGLLDLILPVIVSGNTVVALASATRPYPAILLGEMLAVSDLPGGVVNLLTGRRADLLPTFASHGQIRALHAAARGEEAALLERGSADSLARVRLLPTEPDPESTDLDAIRAFLEFKTVWHPIGS